MSHYPRGSVNQYSSEYHLSRTVPCVGCSTRFHKDLDFVLHGSRCPSCWTKWVQSALVVPVMDCTVFVWVHEEDIEAKVVTKVEGAASVDLAVESVMRANGLEYAFYVWVVPVDDRLPDMHRGEVRCPFVREEV